MAATLSRWRNIPSSSTIVCLYVQLKLGTKAEQKINTLALINLVA